LLDVDATSLEVAVANGIQMAVTGDLVGGGTVFCEGTITDSTYLSVNSSDGKGFMRQLTLQLKEDLMRTLLSGERNAMARARVRHDIICQIQDGDGNWQDYSKWLVSGNWGESKDSPISTGSLALRRYGNYIGRVQVGGAYDRVIRLNMEQGAQNPGEIDYCEEPTELATDNGLEAGTGAGWSFSTNWAISNDGNARTGTWAAKHTAGVANTSAINPARIACVPGDVFYAEGWLKGVSTPDGSALVRIRWLDSGLSTLSVSSGNAVANDGVYHISSLIGTAPASAAFANIEFRIDTASTTGTWYGDDLVFRRYTAGTFRHPNGTVWTIPSNHTNGYVLRAWQWCRCQAVYHVRRFRRHTVREHPFRYQRHR
jgi:hypothetical protein